MQQLPYENRLAGLSLREDDTEKKGNGKDAKHISFEGVHSV